jgi:hypothetical protein
MTTEADKINEQKYYYSDNGTPCGPYTLVELLERIDSESLVYRDGIEWTTARNLDELKKFFRIEKSETNIPSSSVKNDVKKEKKPIIRIALVMVVFSLFGTIAFFLLQGKMKTMQPSNNYPITSKVYQNAQMRGKIVVGCIGVYNPDLKFHSCLKKVFGDRQIKYTVYKNTRDLLEDMRGEKTDIAIVRSGEVQSLQGLLDISNGVIWPGYIEYIHVCFPRNNEQHFKDLMDCPTKHR